jgi:hypothetical protein
LSQRAKKRRPPYEIKISAVNGVRGWSVVKPRGTVCDGLTLDQATAIQAELTRARRAPRR